MHRGAKTPSHVPTKSKGFLAQTFSLGAQKRKEKEKQSRRQKTSTHCSFSAVCSAITARRARTARRAITAAAAAAWSGGGSSACSNSSSCSRKTIHCEAAPTRASARNKGSNWFFVAAARVGARGKRHVFSGSRPSMVPLRRTDGFFFFTEQRGGEENRKTTRRKEERGRRGSLAVVGSAVPAYRRHAASREAVDVLRSSAAGFAVRAGHACFQRAFCSACSSYGPFIPGDAIIVLDSRIRGASARSCGYPTRNVCPVFFPRRCAIIRGLKGARGSRSRKLVRDLRDLAVVLCAVVS